MIEESSGWNDRYVQGQTPWDSGDVSRELIRTMEEYELTPTDGARRWLEVGCGTGTNAIYAAQLGFDVVALDVSALAIETAHSKARDAGVTIDFRVFDLTSAGAATELTAAKGPFQFVFDRGLYHWIRRDFLAEFLGFMDLAMAPGGHWLSLAGNANDDRPADVGPPVVSATELATELEPLFELVRLRECRFDGVVIDGTETKPLAWSALWRKRSKA